MPRIEQVSVKNVMESIAPDHTGEQLRTAARPIAARTITAITARIENRRMVPLPGLPSKRLPSYFPHSHRLHFGISPCLPGLRHSALMRFSPLEPDNWHTSPS